MAITKGFKQRRPSGRLCAMIVSFEKAELSTGQCDIWRQ